MMNVLFWLAFLISITTKYGSCANILMIQHLTLQSHQNVFISIIESLPNHNITFYSTIKLNKNYPNVIFKQLLHPANYITQVESNFINFYDLDPHVQMLWSMIYCNEDYFKDTFEDQEIQKLLKTKAKFDLLFVNSILSEPYYKFAHHFKIPLIEVSSTLIYPWSSEVMGNPNRLGQDIGFIVTDLPTNFTNRLSNFVKHLFVWLYFTWIRLPRLNKFADKYFPPDYPTIQEIRGNTDLIFVNTISKMGYSRAYTPNIIEIGGIHCKPAEALSPELERIFRDSGDHGVIYFSLGGTVKESYLRNFTQTVLDVFRKLPQIILWKWNGTELHDVPSNVIISKWLPQQDILGHNKTKLFITQGGMLSMQEAVYHGVQVLVLPLFNDQFAIAYVTEARGYGLQQRLYSLSGTLFHDQIIELIENPKYKQTVRELSLAIKDVQEAPSERVEWWTEYLLRHKNNRLLQPITRKLSQFQQMEFDIFATIFSLCITIIIFMIFIIYASIIFLLKSYTKYVGQKIKIS